jgi:HlyD family type I secretion membrane fusion protein
MKANDPQLAAIRDQERNSFTARLVAHRGAIALQEQQVDGSTHQIEGLQGRKAATTTQLRSVEEELKSLQPLVERSLVTRSRITTLERAAAGFQGELETIQNSIAAEQTKILTAKGQIELLEKQRKESIANDLSETETRLADVQPRLAGAREKLGRSILVAPESGLVFNLKVFSPGAVLTPGQTVMEIVPADDALVLEIEIDPRDAERVRPGQGVVVHLLPYNQRYQAKIRGTLIKVSADRIDDQTANRSYFRGIVRVNKDDLARTGDVLMPGMPASAVVETGDRPILAYLLDPVFRITNFAMREQ